MTTGNTTLLGLALPVEGELEGTWGDVVNQSITELVDSAIAGTTTLSTDADVTLSTTVLAANQARQAILLWTATNGATTRNITAPAQSKPYIVINAGTGSVVLRGAGPTTGVTIVSGEKCLAAWNGTDFVKVSSSASVTSVGGTGTVNGITLTGTVTSTGNLTLGGALSGVNLTTQVTGTLPIANGGTGATTLAGASIVTYTGTETLTNKTIEAGTFTNGYTEETVTANTSTAYTIDLANGTVQILTLTGNVVYTFPTPVAGKSFTLIQKQDGTGSRTVTWPASVKWPSATAPTLTATASKADKFVFTAIDGSSWLGSVAGQNYTV